MPEGAQWARSISSSMEVRRLVTVIPFRPVSRKSVTGKVRRTSLRMTFQQVGPVSPRGSSRLRNRCNVQLIADHIALFRERFFDFNDGVVRRVEMSLGTATRSLVVEVQCMDRDADSGWSLVTFHLSGVKEFRFELGRRTFEVLSGGLQIALQRNSLYLVFDAYPDDGPELPDLNKNIAYVVAENCEWFSRQEE